MDLPKIENKNQADISIFYEIDIVTATLELDIGLSNNDGWGIDQITAGVFGLGAARRYSR